MQPLAIPAQQWERVSMDFVTHLPKTWQGYDALLSVVDYLTKMLILRPTHSTALAVDIAKIICGFGCEGAWSAKSHCIRQGYEVYKYILA